MSTKLNPEQNLDSKREYEIQLSSSGTTCKKSHTIQNLLAHWSSSNFADYEYIYAMAEMIDTILDLKKGENLYFQSDRDDKGSKGIITRIH